MSFSQSKIYGREKLFSPFLFQKGFYCDFLGIIVWGHTWQCLGDHTGCWGLNLGQLWVSLCSPD